MQPIDTLYNKLEKIGSEISHLFNDGKEHDIIIKVTPEEAKQISKGINLHIIHKNIVKLGKRFDDYEYIKLRLPTGITIQFKKNGEETTD
jgi:hypothetical protein